jgi:16S rRNA (guanine966-N2)-methyltransferase
MRVVAGIAKGRKLNSVPGDSTRPISDRVKVALFDILAGEMTGAVFLDLFAGTGGVGIEALSRGAGSAVFVDQEPAAIQTIRQNLALTHLQDRAAIIRSDSFRYLERKEHPVFSHIYVAPPQYHGLWMKTLGELDRREDWLMEDGMVIIQINPKEYEAPALTILQEFDRRRYGSTLLIFYEKPGK